MSERSPEFWRKLKGEVVAEIRSRIDSASLARGIDRARFHPRYWEIDEVLTETLKSIVRERQRKATAGRPSE